MAEGWDGRFNKFLLRHIFKLFKNILVDFISRSERLPFSDKFFWDSEACECSAGNAAVDGYAKEDAPHGAPQQWQMKVVAGPSKRLTAIARRIEQRVQQPSA